MLASVMPWIVTTGTIVLLGVLLTTRPYKRKGRVKLAFAIFLTAQIYIILTAQGNPTKISSSIWFMELSSIVVLSLIILAPIFFGIGLLLSPSKQKERAERWADNEKDFVDE